MAVTKMYVGQNDDGTPHFSYVSDDPSDVLVVTGPIYGTVEVDGKQIDVSEAVIAVASQEEAVAVSDAIGALHEERGHPAFVNDPNMPNDGFVHIPSKGTTPKKGR